MPPPVSPRAAEDHILTMADGTRLHVEHRAARPAPGSRQASGSLVFMHGFTMHVGPYAHVADAFADAGLHVTSLDCRGHGRSDGRRGYVRRFSDFVDDLEVVLEWTRGRGTPGAPIVVAAHSHGGTIALAHALARRSPVAALALGAPWLGLTMKVPLVKRAMAPVLGLLWPTLALANGIRVEDVTRDPSMQAQIAGDPLVHHVATSRWFNESLSVHAHILASAGSLTVPTFIAIPGQDRIASAEAMAAFAHTATAAGAPVQTRTYPDLFHEVFLEPERDRIIADMVAWLATTLGNFRRD